MKTKMTSYRCRFPPSSLAKVRIDSPWTLHDLFRTTYTDSFSSYDALDVSNFHHIRINNSERLADKHNHINVIESFWNQAKRHLRRFNGIPKNSFYLFLKECEWRFNEGSHARLLKLLKEHAKNSKNGSWLG